MRELTLKRTETSDEGTFGEIDLDGYKFRTGELPYRDIDKDGKSDVNTSCVPTGKYVCKFTYSEKFKMPLYLLLDVPGREGVRIHSANFVGDKTKGLKCEMEGCISLGLLIGKIEAQKAVISSRVAVREFENMMNRREFILKIEDHYLEEKSSLK